MQRNEKYVTRDETGITELFWALRERAAPVQGTSDAHDGTDNEACQWNVVSLMLVTWLLLYEIELIPQRYSLDTGEKKGGCGLKKPEIIYRVCTSLFTFT